MPPSSPPRSAYLHVPFCVHRCGYCNFTLITGRDDLVETYLQAIELELAQLGQPREVDTLYFGGGTPTYLTPRQFRRLAATALRWHPLRSDYEWTVEANPLDLVTQDHDSPKDHDSMVRTLAELGVTRLSLGIQSFRDEKLQLLERDHRAEDILKAVEMARNAGLRVAIDLIFATPGERLDQWEADLTAAIDCQPEHVSTYGLTFERGTTFWGRRLRSELQEVDEELQRDMFALAIDRLTAVGLEHYEVSNFAQPGCRSRHNQAYWSGEGYYAAGPGAARYVEGVRETNHQSTTTYLKRLLAGKSPVDVREKLDAESRARELLVFGLRRMEGIARSQFFEATGWQIDQLVAGPLAKFVDLGLLSDDGERIQLTREGLFVSDAMWPEMV